MVTSPQRLESPREQASLGHDLREAFRTHGATLSSPGFRALAVCRFGVWRNRIRTPLLRKALRIPYTMMARRMRHRYRIELHYTGSFGRRLHLSDQGDIVIFNRTIIGDDCSIGHGVTLGKVLMTDPGFPTIGNGVVIGPGAVIVGNIRVGDNVVVGPNAVVMTNVPDGSTVLPRAAEVHAGAGAGAGADDRARSAASQDVVAPAGESIPAADASAQPRLRALLREDWVTHGRSWFNSGFQALAAHRLANAPRPGSRAVRLSAAALAAFRRLARNPHRISLSPHAVIGRRVRLASTGPIVVMDDVQIGDDCAIEEGSTLGWGMDRGTTGPVCIGSGVHLASGSVVVRGVNIGAGAYIGFNAVVMQDVPAGGVASAPSAKILRPMKVSAAPAPRAAVDVEVHAHG
jgi:serine O-acetyltransferase